MPRLPTQDDDSPIFSLYAEVSQIPLKILFPRTELDDFRLDLGGDVVLGHAGVHPAQGDGDQDAGGVHDTETDLLHRPRAHSLALGHGDGFPEGDPSGQHHGESRNVHEDLPADPHRRGALVSFDLSRFLHNGDTRASVLVFVSGELTRRECKAPGKHCRSFQLFDVVYREETLLNVIRSVTRNGRSIILTAVLALILVYMFSIIGYMFFKEDFLVTVDKKESECDGACASSNL